MFARPLRHRGFALMWVGNVVSSTGAWMQSATLGIFVAATTDGALWTALVATVTYLALGLLQPVGGVIADHFDRRRVLLIGQTTQSLGALTLLGLFATGHTHPALLVLIVALEGIANALSNPSWFAMTPDLVDREEVPQAAFLGMAAWNAGRTIGPAIAGVAVLADSYELVFLFNAISFAFVVGCVTFVRVASNPRPDSISLPARLREGVRIVLHEPGMRWTLTLSFVAVFFVTPLISLIPVMNRDALHGRPSDAALILASLGVGSVINLMIAGTLIERVGYRRVFRIVQIAVPVFAILYALSTTVWMAAVAAAFFGGAYAAVLACSSATINLRSDPEARGRAISIFWAVVNVALFPAALMYAVLIDLVGVRATIAGCAAVLLTLTLLWRNRHQHALAVDVQHSAPC